MTVVPNRKSEQGFTIVELMIALSVLSVILVACTVVLINIDSLYTKGVNGANLQSTSRNIMADVTAAIQFGGSAPTWPTTNPTTYDGEKVYTYCIGTSRYNYVLDRELGEDDYADPGHPIITAHVLWKDNIENGAPCTSLDITQSTPANPSGGTPGTGGYEMAGDHMSLTNFTVAPSGGDAYTVDVWMAYGDYDLVQPGTSGLTGTPPTCSGNTGTQFCSTSVLTSLVTGRVY